MDPQRRAIGAAALLAASALLFAGCSSSAVTELDQSSDEAVVRSVLALAADGDTTACDGMWARAAADEEGIAMSDVPDDNVAHTHCATAVEAFAEQFDGDPVEFLDLAVEQQSGEMAVFEYNDSSWQFGMGQIDGLHYLGLPSFERLAGTAD